MFADIDIDACSCIAQIQLRICHGHLLMNDRIAFAVCCLFVEAIIAGYVLVNETACPALTVNTALCHRIGVDLQGCSLEDEAFTNVDLCNRFCGNFSG